MLIYRKSFVLSFLMLGLCLLVRAADAQDSSREGYVIPSNEEKAIAAAQEFSQEFSQELGRNNQLNETEQSSPSDVVAPGVTTIPSVAISLGSSNSKTPEMKEVPSGPEQPLTTTLKVKTWESANVRHRALLFEEPALERYGVSRNQNYQPVFSGIHFFARGFAFPLTIGKHRRFETTPVDPQRVR